MKNQKRLGLDDEAEKLIVENIVATDFFMFDRAFGEHKETEQAENDLACVSSKRFPKYNSLYLKILKNKVYQSNHDEEMPYTFMWWLDKTRKEHAWIYQPYAKSETEDSHHKLTNTPDALQHQYVENIFHLTSVEELEKRLLHTQRPKLIQSAKSM